jgi:hypothetical protein
VPRYEVHGVDARGAPGRRILHVVASVLDDTGFRHCNWGGYAVHEDVATPISLARRWVSVAGPGVAHDLPIVMPTRDFEPGDVLLCSVCAQPERAEEQPELPPGLAALLAERGLPAPTPSCCRCPSFARTGAPADHHPHARHALALRMHAEPPTTHRVACFRGLPLGHVHADHHEIVQAALDAPPVADHPCAHEDGGLWAAVHLVGVALVLHHAPS